MVFFPVDITEIWEEEELPEEKDAGIADEDEENDEDDEQDEDDHLSDENAVEGPEDPCREFSVCVLYVVEVRAS